MNDIERELESELHRVLDPLSALPIPSRRAPAGRSAARRVLGGAGAALSLKLLTGVVAAAAAVTVAGTVTTGSLNPLDWGQQVSQRVEDCKAKLADGQHDIGDCVSSFANQHGTAVASDARHHGQGTGNDSGNGNGSSNAHGNNGNANDHAKDKIKDRPQPSPKTSSAGGPEPNDPATHPAVTIPPQP